MMRTLDFVAEIVLRKARVYRVREGEDIDIIGRTKWNVTVAFSAIERMSTKVGLAVNEGKTKYIVTFLPF